MLSDGTSPSHRDSDGFPACKIRMRPSHRMDSRPAIRAAARHATASRRWLAVVGHGFFPVRLRQKKGH